MCSGLKCASQHAPQTISRRDFTAAACCVRRGVLRHPAAGATDRVARSQRRSGGARAPRTHARGHLSSCAASTIWPISNARRTTCSRNSRPRELKPREQMVEADGKQFRNLIARFGPRDGPLIVIGAHYDSCGDTPGADDNASGVAGLLELARLLAQNPPEHAVELVAYTLEEPPYFRTDSMGSFWHARELRRTESRSAPHALARDDRLLSRCAEDPGLSGGGAQAAVSGSRAISSASSRHSAISAPRAA